MKVRVAASVVLAGLIAVGMSACVFITPQQTTGSYTPSDGINGETGDIQIRNALIVTDGAGTGSLIAGLQNTATADRSVTVQYTSTLGPQTLQVLVPASSLLALRTVPSAGSPVPSRSVLLENIDATQGGLFPVYIAQGSKGEALRLPVLNGSLPSYATLVPTPTPSPLVPTPPVPTPGTGDSAVPTDSPSPTVTP